VVLQEFYISSLHWSFYFVNDNIDVDFENPQIMRCIFCHDNPINATNPRT
jgi:hypothetical protein